MENNHQKQRMIQSLQRAIDIIDVFDSANTELSLHEISQKVGLNKTTVFGLLKTLLANSYINQNQAGGKYRLGIKFLEKGSLVSEGLDLRMICRPYLYALTGKYREASHLCLYQQGEVYIIDKVEAPDAYLIMSSKIGRMVPFHATASGKMVLAYLNKNKANSILAAIELERFTDKTITEVDLLKKALALIREQGYSLEEEEIEKSAYSIAAPIFNHLGRITGSISLSGPTIRIKDNQEEIIQELLHISKIISGELGFKEKAAGN